MRRSFLRSLAATLAVVLASGPTPSSSAEDIYAARKVVGRLRHVAALTFAPDGTLYFAERATGRIKTWARGAGKQLFYAIPRVVNDPNSELGLLGLAFHPDYPAEPYLYAYATRVIRKAYRIQVVRIEDADLDGAGDALKVVWKAPSKAGGGHVGGRIMFGPDGRFYVVLGEKFDPRLAQDLDSERGKILRMRLNATDDRFLVPADNPDPTRPYYAYGVRNSFGFDFDPETGNLWESDNGPACNDELNRVPAGANLAWGPNATCSTPPRPPRNTNRDGPKPRTLPEAYWTPTIAPTGVVFCDGCGLDAAAEGALFLGAFNTRYIRRVTLDGTRTAIVSKPVVYRHTSRVLSTEAAPDGRLYFADGKAIWRLRMP